MNRYSLVFAMLVASSFAVHPTQAGDGSAGAGAGNASASSQARAARPGRGIGQFGEHGAQSLLTQDAVKLIGDFVAKAGDKSEPAKNIQILFATVPHPVETHLAAAFDHNVDALQDGLQEAGYLFDSSWIPWDAPREREGFADDAEEKKAQQEEDDTPGVLLFRRRFAFDANARGGDPARDPYAHGLLVFLLSEKPTEGIAVSELDRAFEILKGAQVDYSGQIRILGPSYSGSFASLVATVKRLHKENKNPGSEILIRSGPASVGNAAAEAMREIAAALPGTTVNFGSTGHDSADWTNAAVDVLKRMGIEPASTIAELKESESLFGSLKPQAPSDRVAQQDTGTWKLGFPRDISSLRADYEQQGLFDSSAPAEPWKRFLKLKSSAENQGDSVRSFGGTVTIETQEAVLFGISEFLSSHKIRAAIISATNEEDRLFLTQFLHANNPSVRVVVIGATRIFMRGSTAQFRGDLMVDSFPMLPRLHDWTGADSDHAVRVFGDSAAEGTYFAAVDLFGRPQEPDGKYKWYPEYSEPDWASQGGSVQWPPMYVVALGGGNSTWPVAEERGSQFSQPDPGHFLVEMPFTLFEHNKLTQSARQAAPVSPAIRVGRHWKMLFVVVGLLVLFYCAAIWYANPICRENFASLHPSETWDFWMLKAMVPAIVSSGAFWMLGWAIAMPLAAQSPVLGWWWAAEAGIVLGPAAVLGSALGKAAWKRVRLHWIGWAGISVLLSFMATVTLAITALRATEGSGAGSVSAILNSYREMHWESGLSLVPTWLLFLAAIFVWASQAGSGAKMLLRPLPLPVFSRNLKISQWRAEQICAVGRPLPSWKGASSLWKVWAVPVAILLMGHFFFRPFQEITTLESSFATLLVRSVAVLLVALILFDVLQFIWVWDALQGLLRALDREQFKRSFVPIRDFDWRSLWSFSGVSFQSRRAINAELIECLEDIAGKHGIKEVSAEDEALRGLHNQYNNIEDLCIVGLDKFSADAKAFLKNLKGAGNKLADWIWDPANAGTSAQVSPNAEALQRAIEGTGSQGRFADEEEELARLSEPRKAVERFLCLMYIGFIQTVVARLHTLLVAVALMFSMLVLGIAIYPFLPIVPLLIPAGMLFLLIGWAFFRVFSQMDTDPILSRIVNGDDRKLQGSFYFKFAEAMALPLLTVGSSLLPGGVGRLLELVQALVPHGQ